jgi:CRISPR-associated DxTHG motif protein
MKVLSFLGTTIYKPITYVWTSDGHEQAYTTELFPEAVAHFFQPEHLIIFVTPQVRQHANLRELRSRLGDLVKAVDIPEGKSESELWQMFDIVTSTVGEGEAIVLDVTHAFRSIPLSALVIAAYMRRTKDVDVKRIVYGAYEARQPPRKNPKPSDRAPVFDVTPLLDLLDWLSGAQELLGRGDGRSLAQRMEDAHNFLHRQPNSDLKPKTLREVARKLSSLSRSLHLARPLEVMKDAQQLLPMLDAAKDELHAWAKPFGLIVERVRAEVAALAYESPERLDIENLHHQLDLIEYYLNKGLTVQAITLAREWVVSWACLQQGHGDWLSRVHREGVEEALNSIARQARPSRTRTELTAAPEWLQRVAEEFPIKDVWDRIVGLRNDVAHCGMSAESDSASNIEQKARELPERLASLLAPTLRTSIWGRRVVIDLKQLYGDVAKLEDLGLYLQSALEMAGEGNDVVLTGQAPVWLYLAVAHALHGKARRLIYSSPVTGEIVVFDHAAR